MTKTPVQKDEVQELVQKMEPWHLVQTKTKRQNRIPPLLQDLIGKQPPPPPARNLNVTDKEPSKPVQIQILKHPVKDILNPVSVKPPAKPVQTMISSELVKGGESTAFASDSKQKGAMVVAIAGQSDAVSANVGNCYQKIEPEQSKNITEKELKDMISIVMSQLALDMRQEVFRAIEPKLEQLDRRVVMVTALDYDAKLAVDKRPSCVEHYLAKDSPACNHCFLCIAYRHEQQLDEVDKAKNLICEEQLTIYDVLLQDSLDNPLEEPSIMALELARKLSAEVEAGMINQLGDHPDVPNLPMPDVAPQLVAPAAVNHLQAVDMVEKSLPPIKTTLDPKISWETELGVRSSAQSQAEENLFKFFQPLVENAEFQKGQPAS